VARQEYSVPGATPGRGLLCSLPIVIVDRPGVCVCVVVAIRVVAPCSSYRPPLLQALPAHVVSAHYGSAVDICIVTSGYLARTIGR